MPFRVGRESREEFNEPGAGRTYEYWKSLPADGSTGQADNAVQAYNYRLCLTNDPKNMVPFTRPDNYNRDEYVSLIEDVWTGRNTQRAMLKVTNEMLEENRRHIAKGNRTKLPGDSWGIWKLSSLVNLPTKRLTVTISTLLSFLPICPKKTGHGPPPRGNGGINLPNA